MHNNEKWPNSLENSCAMKTARFWKYVWPFFSIMHESGKNRKICKHITTRFQIIIKDVVNVVLINSSSGPSDEDYFH